MTSVTPRYSAPARGSRLACVTGALARGVAFGLFALVLVPFILTTPAHATDDNTVSIAVDQNAALQPAGNLYKATTNVTVKTGKPYGFNLTMQADTADLLNSKDSTHKISAPQSAASVVLGANQWGYSLNKSATTFSAVPSGAQAASPSAQSGVQPPATSVTPAVIIDTAVKGKQAGCNCKDHCATTVTFAANIDPAKLASGSYSTAITYTATAKPAPKPPVVEPTVCKSGDSKNDCQVDIDPNMIPVKYTGSTTNAQWTSLANPEDAAHQGEWYNYNNKQWANALTVKKEALAKYKGQTKVVDRDDILSFWVYIPRYAYEVMRRDGTDKPVKPQNFLISFEKVTPFTKKQKRSPAACPEQGKDYRTECGLNRDYIKGKPSAQGTWATHPAFTFGSKELNGIWFAKFETTGTTTQPTVLPNEAHISGNYDGMNNQVGNFYSLAKTLGVADRNNFGGSGFTTKHNHNLTKFSSHMVNNNDWGAATYLSASKYGAGYNGVQINANGAWRNIYSGTSYGTTGCGPRADGNTSEYDNSGDLDTPQACGDVKRAYNGSIGKLASTTNNVYGIYDMSGGGLEYVAASYTSDVNLHNSSTTNFSKPANPPYVNNYSFDDPNKCTFATCGGQALYETNDGTNNSDTAQWNGNYMYFVNSSYSWFARGGGFYDGSNAGLFFAGGGFGDSGNHYAFRVALAPAPHD